MDPVTISAVLLAVVGGVAGEAGGKLWDGLVALVRRPRGDRTGVAERAAERCCRASGTGASPDG